MTFRTVIQWPDLTLKEISKDVVHFDENLGNLINDMYDTLKVLGGAGLAAPQVGVLKRAVIIKCSVFNWKNVDHYSQDDDILALINPILELSGPPTTWKEGCLSVKNFEGTVTRSSNAHVTYQDLAGNIKELSVPWPFSGALQHECDHLDGIVFLDRMGKRRSKEIKNKIYRQMCRARPKKEKIKKIKPEPIDTRLSHGPGKRKKSKKIKKNKKK